MDNIANKKFSERKVIEKFELTQTTLGDKELCLYNLENMFNGIKKEIKEGYEIDIKNDLLIEVNVKFRERIPSKGELCKN